MEGVGARLGRSSTRYGPATVFSGPVRKWKKRWVHHLSSSSSSNHNNNNNAAAAAAATTSSNGNNGSNNHLLLYKWTPYSQSQSTNHNTPAAAASDPLLLEEPPRKFKYIPVYLLEKQKKEAEEKDEDEAKLIDAEAILVESIPKGDGFEEKPDINDIPMEETQDDNQVVRQDLNESTLDLSLGLNSHDEDSDLKPDQPRDGQLGRVNSSGVET
ncbi:uncharacterized protein LOC126665582 [Mercurialis annua]|uniref:uncharacterized protein LOC126665582 n=1 Tax=Mercurialis annua TaxID=3986 RepID=UPI00215DF9BE|nr:uncharacterized protein LOC126665582 [Mercurialis annua]